MGAPSVLFLFIESRKRDLSCLKQYYLFTESLARSFCSRIV
ncbi:hypothetical protein Leryth_022659, partial [Lithospermum erythrorhizon]